ncbi:MAG: MFS transporter, partial [Spongiibacteraceae bacterium]|nr:MFS transporter [Spongiibacteraceae bacterium]
MCFGFLGIQFGFALQNANVSRIFQTLGASIEDIPILWIAAPVTGLLVQPVIGYLSDRTWNRLGRRRPYFFWGAVLSTLALIAMPHSPLLWVAAICLWLLDASINISMEPFRAFVGDMLPPEQRAQGYAMQSFFIGIGAVVASALPWLLSNVAGVANHAVDGGIPDSVTYSFYIGAGVFFGAVMWTVIRTREYSPEQLQSFSQAEQITTVTLGKNLKVTTGALWWVLAGCLFTGVVFWQQWNKQLMLLGAACLVFGLLKYWAGLLQRFGKTQSPLCQIMQDMA